MFHKKVLKYLLAFVFVLSFAAAVQISAGGDPGGGPACCYKACSGVGLGDHGHWVDHYPEMQCVCVDPDSLFTQCLHECNICLEQQQESSPAISELDVN